MGNRVTRMRLFSAAVAATAVLAAPATASAATVVNGDFETGNLSGWQVVNNPPSPEESGSWLTYTGTAGPFEGFAVIPPPPAGNYAATTDQGGPGSHILYQDLTLEPYYTHSLSLLAYYGSAAPLVTPSPNTLSFETVENQQYRIDVMKPTAPVDSVAAGDTLATVFATNNGDPQQLGSTSFTADLTPFAGQTVRLRFAEVDNEGFFNAAVDSVAIQSTPPSNAVVLGKPAQNKRNGTAKLPVTVPGAGTLKIADVKKTKKRIKAKTLQVTAAGTVKLPVKPTKFARKVLADNGKLKLKVAVTFTPTGGLAATVTRKLTLKLAPK
jgi:hypothetical protein